MLSSPCPPLDDLRAYALGQLSEEAETEIARHVETCTDCESTGSQFDHAADSLVAGLRSPQGETEFVAEDEYRLALDRVAAIGRDLSHSGGAAVAVAGDDSDEPEQIRDYRLLEKLGEGGMGTVYKALHTRLEKTVALKILTADRLRDPLAVARFEREMKAVGRLEHPHIVAAVDAGEADGRHFLVTEYVKGCDLSELSRRLGPLPIAEACELIRQAAVALQHAHQRGMVHRDIKPSNLMLATTDSHSAAEKSAIRDGGTRDSGSSAIVKVLDLGLALISDLQENANAGLTASNQIMGTVDYMAPEQAGDTHNVDIRADVYSLGATLYKLLTGSSIYQTDRQQSVMQKLSALANQPVPPIGSRREGLPEELCAVVHRMLEKDPAERFATPAEVASALEPFCAGNNLSALLQPADAEQTIANTGAAADSASLHDGSVETQDAVEADPVLQPTLISTQDHVAETVSRPRPASGVRARWVLGGLALALLAAAGLYYSGIFFKLKRADGTLVIEVENANARDLVVEVNNEKRSIEIGADGKSVVVSVEPGTKRLVVKTADGILLKTDVGQEVEIVTGGKRKIKAWLEAANGKGQRVDGPKVLAKWKPLPYQQQFIDAVARLTPEKQAMAVIERLQVVNPNRNKREWKHKIENGQVTLMQEVTHHVSFRQACMKRFGEFAIVSGFTIGEAGDGERKSARNPG